MCSSILTMQPLFSIITATYNASPTIERTVRSIVGQTFKDYEHIIVDGASKDNTLKIVRGIDDPRRKIVSEPDRGLYDAMNKGLAAARGQYVIFLNAGDKFHSSDTLQVLAQAIEKNGHPGIVYGQTVLVDDNGRLIGPRHLSAPAGLTLKDFSRGMLVCHQAFVANRNIVGGYNLRYRFSADYDWCIRCLQHSRKNVGLTDTVLIDYLSEGLTTANRRKSLMERFKIMCYYYGTMPTILRHVGFALRWFKREHLK